MSNINKVLIWGGFNSWVYPKLNLHHLLYGQQSQIIPIHSNFHLPFNSISPCDVALDRTVWRLRAGVVDAANPLDVVDGIVPLVGVASVDEVNTDWGSGSGLGPDSDGDDDDGPISDDAPSALLDAMIMANAHLSADHVCHGNRIQISQGFVEWGPHPQRSKITQSIHSFRSSRKNVLCRHYHQTELQET